MKSNPSHTDEDTHSAQEEDDEEDMEYTSKRFIARKIKECKSSHIFSFPSAIVGGLSVARYSFFMSSGTTHLLDQYHHPRACLVSCTLNSRR